MKIFDRDNGERAREYREFSSLIGMISELSPFQSKRLRTMLSQQDVSYWVFAEEVSVLLKKFVGGNPSAILDGVKAYNSLCLNMFKDQLTFRKTGIYSLSDAAAIQAAIYDNPVKMQDYMIGLLISQMLWKNHYSFFRFFQRILSEVKPRSYLEVGGGHGLFALYALKAITDLKVVICDISPVSLNICQKMLMVGGASDKQVVYVQGNFLQQEFNGDRFDVLVLGEVLEHVQEPGKFLQHVKKFLAPQGCAYISTCANCPAPDHIYHFHSVDEMRQILLAAGFSIREELALPAEDVPCSEWEKQCITINYAAVISLDRK